MSDRHHAWFKWSLVAAVLISVPAVARFAHARGTSQQSVSSIEDTGAAGTSEPGLDDTDTQGLDESNPNPAAASPDADDNPAPEDATDPADPNSSADQNDNDESAPPAVARDPGEVNVGDLASGEPLTPPQGVDVSPASARDTAEIELADQRAARRDPLLYQIEDLNPITDNRTTARLFRQEPYDPVGIKIGSFVLFPELDLGTSYYSNVFHAPSAKSDVAFDVVPSARLVSNWSRHALEFSATGILSFYNDYATEDDRDYQLEARGRLDITSRANIQALISRQQSFEDRSALDASSAGTRAKIIEDQAVAAYNQKFNRLSLQFRGSISDYSYGSTEDAGTVTNNKDRDYTQYEEAARATWELKPQLSPFFEVAVNHRDYSEAAQSDGINRTSNGERYRFGISFGNDGDIVRGEISLGYGVQTPSDRRLHPVDGLIIDANATWRVTPLTSILFNAMSDVSETTTADVGGAFYRSASIGIRHELRRYLVVSAAFNYSNQDSQDGVISDNEFREILGIEYFADRNTVLYGRYEHVNFDGIGIPNDYVGDEIHVGVRLRR
ncbi:MAG: outer membrane beta-barrel protein [Hyphomicrobium sp.]|uniref:outer membrane beta-barrel protein n=1 Tax=Hyphomicrobium sp. TaxID=82 RepID=UPI00356AD24C